jgi:phosphodiesterase/alkaline phosphatase D-like protein
VTAKTKTAFSDVVLRVNDGTTDTDSAMFATDADNVAKLAIDGLAADTEYTYQVLLDGVPAQAATGRFRTLPAAGVAANFMVAFSGDAETGSTRQVFDTIVTKDPLMMIHMGDLHYANIATNTPSLFHTEYDRVLASAPQARMLRNVPTAYVWDDHDYGPNNADGTSASKPAAASVYRARVPHYSLPDATGIWQTWDIGRVRFVITDQRSAASPKADTDNSSKTMLGATQKTWFKGILSNSAGMLIVWICPRWFGMPASAGADSWAGFTTERQELADYIKANCHGRVIVLSADLHTLALDDGTNHDFATGGGEPLPTFQAAALDKTPATGGGTYSHGEYLTIGQFGTMAIADSGGATLDVTWKGWNILGTQLVTHTFTVTL